MSPMTELGALVQDRPWAVGGRLGPPAGRVPATLKITDGIRHLTRTFHVQAFKHRELAMRVLAAGVLAAVSAAYTASGEGMARVKLHVRGSDGCEISREDRYYHEGMLALPAISNLVEACSILNQNRFRPQDVEALEYEAEFTNLKQTAAIESLHIDQPLAKAGEDLTVHVCLRPDGGEVVEKSVTLRLPLDLEKGRIRIGVAGGADGMRLRSRLGVLPPTFYSLADIVREFQRTESATGLLVGVGIPNREVAVQGVRLPGLPPHLDNLIQSSLRTDVQRGGGEVSRLVETPWVLYGAAITTIATEDREGRRGAAAPRKSTASADDDEGDEEDAATPALPRGVPASLQWAASGFARPAAEAAAPVYHPFTLPRVDSSSDKPAVPAAKAKDKSKDEEEDESATETKDTKPKKDDTVARAPSVWSQTSADHFAAADIEGLAVHSDGVVRLVPRWQKLQQLSELYACSLAVQGAALYVGTMDPGNVYRIADGKTDLVFRSGEFAISALSVSPSGAIMAATLPHGRIFRILPDGKGEPFAQVDAVHVWDLLADGDRGWWVATGGAAARLYHLDTGGKVDQQLEIRQSHAVRLLMLGDALYVATAQAGALYRVESGRRLISLFDAGKNDITAVAPGDKGSLLVATAPEGKVIEVDPRGATTTLYTAAGTGVLSLAHVGGRILAGLGDKGQIIHVVDATRSAVLREEDAGQVTALAGVGSLVYAAGANPGIVLRADFAAAAEGKLDSTILDAKRLARWGRADWQAAVPEGTSLVLRLRSGNSADPADSSWSPWSAPLSQPGREKVPAPSAQYLQYRLEMTQRAGALSPSLDWVRISYLPADQQPTVRDLKPEAGQAISGKFKLQWKMEDPDKDRLQAKVLIRTRGTRDFRIIKEGLTKAEYEWDTKGTDDGAYDLQVIADDGLANPGEAREARLEVHNVIVDNSAPELEGISGPAEQADGSFALTGFAMDANCNLANIAWQVKGEDVWHAVRLDDGLYDWRYERFLIVTGPLKETVPELLVRARDAAGNVCDKTFKLPRKAAAAGKSPAAAKTPVTPAAEAKTSAPATGNAVAPAATKAPAPAETP